MFGYSDPLPSLLQRLPATKRATLAASKADLPYAEKAANGGPLMYPPPPPIFIDLGSPSCGHSHRQAAAMMLAYRRKNLIARIFQALTTGWSWQHCMCPSPFWNHFRNRTNEELETLVNWPSDSIPFELVR